MAEYTRRPTPARRSAAALAIVGALAAGACGGSENTQAALSQDSALARDVALANRTDSAAQPQLQDVPAAAPAPAPEPAAEPAPAPAPAPRAESRPAPRPAAPRPTPRPTPRPSTSSGSGEGAAPARARTGSVAAGTTLSLTANEKVCTNTHKVGERFTASLAESVTGENGARIPAGATATLEVTQSERQDNARDKIRFDFRVVQVTFGGQSYAVDGATESADITKVRGQSKDRQKVIGGAVLGAIAGQVLGKDTKGTVIGAATGAAAGAATAAATANFEGCVNEGAGIRVRLNDAVSVKLQ